jgi:tRNA G18 (ribose-2'-O)-methylase SpoU
VTVARFVPIADAADERVRRFTGMKDAELRRDLEEGGGFFVAEGLGTIRRALSSPYPLRSLLLSPRRAVQLEDELAALEVDVFVASREVMAEVAGFDLHRGALALAGRLPLRPVAEVVEGARCVVVLEAVNDHENLGAIARSASALGADAMLLDPTCADPLYRRSVRVSMGEVLHVPFTRSADWPGDLHLLAAAGFTLVALTPSPDAMAIDQFDAGPRVAVLLGAEGPGLSAAALAAAVSVRIPIRPSVDSLNVGHAAAIALHRLAPRPST